MRDDLRKGYANTADGQLHYAEAGSGQHLLLLEETPRTYRFFERLMFLLAPQFHVIALDLPGLGNSHALPSPASIPAMAACVASFLGALDIKHAHVFGMHTGNKVAASFAADFSEQVDKLILAGQPHSITPSKAERNAALGPAFQRYQAAKEDKHDGQYRLLREWLSTKLTLDAGWWPEKVLTGDAIDADLIHAAERKRSTICLAGEVLFQFMKLCSSSTWLRLLLAFLHPHLSLNWRRPRNGISVRRLPTLRH